MRLSGKRAIVTGAAHGIGRAAALRFAREGCRVLAADVDDAAGAALAVEAASAGLPLAFRHADVTNAAAVATLVAEAERRFGGLDTAFVNAGIEQVAADSDALAEEHWSRVLAVNLTGTFLTCQAAISAMLRAGGGAIVTNASVAAFANVGQNAAYAASKGGVMALTRVLAIEYAARNIRVNAVCAGVIDTAMNARHRDRAADPDAWMEAARAITPLGRLGTAEEVASLALFLASDEAAFITGTGMLVDGGRVAT
ncbi:SDR family NAD(P)-dependent oxidoreductase [Elioraea sp.]|uniref:SDR family oxidoreductase n=1 Tax=Elioraea sp. TaxID=2185103 RepID=UPI0025BAA83B|nr:SDR family NAD(P)-dependent oxidoreductase [Elioraea sp.]